MKIIGISGTNSSDSPTEKLVNFTDYASSLAGQFAVSLDALPV